MCTSDAFCIFSSCRMPQNCAWSIFSCRSSWKSSYDWYASSLPLVPHHNLRTLFHSRTNTRTRNTHTKCADRTLTLPRLGTNLQFIPLFHNYSSHSRLRQHTTHTSHTAHTHLHTPTHDVHNHAHSLSSAISFSLWIVCYPFFFFCLPA